MDEYIQRTQSPFTKFHHHLSRHSAITSLAILIWLNLIFVGPIAEAVELPTVDEVMKELKVSDSDKEKIRQGADRGVGSGTGARDGFPGKSQTR